MNDKYLQRFFTDREGLQRLLNCETIVEMHADNQEEERDDILLLAREDVPCFLIFYHAYPYGVVVRCELGDADFRLEYDDQVIYVQWYRVNDDIVELGSRRGACTWLVTQSMCEKDADKNHNDGLFPAIEDDSATVGLDSVRAKGEEKLRTLLQEYDSLQPAKHHPGDDQQADERLAEVVPQIDLLVELLGIDQARLDTVYRVIIHRDSKQSFIIHAYAILQLYFMGRLKTFNDMLCFRQLGEIEGER